MPTPQQVQNVVDAFVAARLNVIQGAQASYAAAHGGRFAQVLRACSVDPADGATRLPDQADARPYYQAESLADLLPALAHAPLPANVEVHQYNGPLGRGWILILTATIAGQTWTRVRDLGPEGRDQPWTLILGGVT